MPRSQKRPRSQRLDATHPRGYEPYRFEKPTSTDQLRALVEKSCNNIQRFTLQVVGENGMTSYYSSKDDSHVVYDSQPTVVHDLHLPQYTRPTLTPRHEPAEFCTPHGDESVNSDDQSISDMNSASVTLARTMSLQDGIEIMTPSYSSSSGVDGSSSQVNRPGRKKEFRISETEEVKAYLMERFTEMQQLSNKLIAKLWIRGICPRKQAKFPYMNRKRAEMTDDAPEVPEWWPDVAVCKFTEPDHVKKDARKALLIHLLRLRPSPERLCEMNRDDSAKPNPIHIQRGWTDFLQSLTPNSAFERLVDMTPEKANRCSRLLEDLYRVAKMEEKYKLSGLGGDTIVQHFSDMVKVKNRRRRRSLPSFSPVSESVLRHDSVQDIDGRWNENAMDSKGSLAMLRDQIDVPFKDPFCRQNMVNLPAIGPKSLDSCGPLDSRSTVSCNESPADATAWSSPSFVSVITSNDSSHQSPPLGCTSAVYDQSLVPTAAPHYEARFGHTLQMSGMAGTPGPWLDSSYGQPVVPIYQTEVPRSDMQMTAASTSFLPAADEVSYGFDNFPQQQGEHQEQSDSMNTWPPPIPMNWTTTQPTQGAIPYVSAPDTNEMYVTRAPVFAQPTMAYQQTFNRSTSHQDMHRHLSDNGTA